MFNYSLLYHHGCAPAEGDGYFVMFLEWFASAAWAVVAGHFCNQGKNHGFGEASFCFCCPAVSSLRLGS